MAIISKILLSIFICNQIKKKLIAVRIRSAKNAIAIKAATISNKIFTIFFKVSTIQFEIVFKLSQRYIILNYYCNINEFILQKN